MSKTPLALIVSLLAIGFTGGALAQTTTPDAKKQKQEQKDKKRAQLEKNFKAADKNGDGALSREELAKNKEWTANFDKMDANKDGKITMAEHDAWQKQKADAKKAERASSKPK